MNVLILGYMGLVGKSLAHQLLAADAGIRGLDLHEGGDVTNLTILREAVASKRASVGAGRFDWVVNLAAMTAVDACESDPRAAFAANADGAKNAAVVAEGERARFLQVSTDYVFDGARREPYSETDAPHPISVYGESKLRGEQYVSEVVAADRLLIVRGQSLYGQGLKSFPDAIVRVAREGKQVPVVTNQVISPTWADDFAKGLVTLMVKGETGIFHLSSSGHCSWFEFAQFVFKEWHEDVNRIVPITTEDLGRPAKRPAWSVFDLSRFEGVVEDKDRPRHWQVQFQDYARSKGRAA